MAYSINPVLHPYKNDHGQKRIILQIIFNRMIVRLPTDYRVLPEQFENGQVINHPNKIAINGNIRNVSTAIEARIIAALRAGSPTKNELIALVNNAPAAKVSVTFVQFIHRHISEMEGKKTAGTLAVYNSLIYDIEKYAPGVSLNEIDISWLNLYEKYQRSLGWDINTIHKKMSKIKTLLNRASDADLIDEKQFRKYAVPLYVQKIPEYISEDEMETIKNICDAVGNATYKMAGYYFLLACYAGYRLSDLKKFDYDKSVKDDKIILRAKKNKAIVLMPLHTRLVSVLEYVRHNPCNIAEQNLRDYVKEIVKLAGIKRHIKIHTARHSFAMMLMDNGFELEDVATLLGVSIKTAGIYGRISNKRLERLVRGKLG